MLDHIHSGNHQQFQGYLLNLDKKQITLDNISAILRNRDCESDLVKWEELIHGFPDSPNFNLGLRYTNLFYQLLTSYGGPMQVIFNVIVIFIILHYFLILLDSCHIRES